MVRVMRSLPLREDRDCLPQSMEHQPLCCAIEAMVGHRAWAIAVALCIKVIATIVVCPEVGMQPQLLAQDQSRPLCWGVPGSSRRGERRWRPRYGVFSGEAKAVKEGVSGSQVGSQCCLQMLSWPRCILTRVIAL